MHPNDGRVISNFIVQALNNDDITIFGEGSQTRSFCYIDDMVDGLIKLMESGDDVIGPTNLGNPKEYSIGQLAKKVIEMTGSKSKIVYRPLPPDDPRRRQPSIELAKKQLGWTPKVELEDGLRKTIDYFKEVIKS